MLKVALLWPKGFHTDYVLPLSLGYLKSNVDNARYDVRIFDCSFRDLPSDSPALERELVEFAPDVVGVSSWSPMFLEAMNLLRLAKRLNPETVTVIGGSHATTYADKVFKDMAVDFLFRGEAELSFPLFLEELQKPAPDWSRVKGLMYRTEGGAFVKNELNRVEDLDLINLPDYEAINFKCYIERGYRYNTPVARNAPLWVTRGCPYLCKYCSAPLMNGRRIRAHSVEYVLNWVKTLYHERDIRWFNIIDDNFTFDSAYAKEFCRAVIALGLKDVGFGTPNGIRMQRGDPELWRLMKEAGWQTLIVSPESGSPHTLEIMKKDLKLDMVQPVVRDIKAAGLKVQACFVLGYPGETGADLKMTADLIRRCAFNFVFLNNFQPLPGTPIFDELVEKGEIPDNLLPSNFSDGSRVYTPRELKDFNFTGYRLKIYMLMALRNPLNIPYMIGLFSPSLLARKLWTNVKSLFSRPAREAKAVQYP